MILEEASAPPCRRSEAQPSMKPKFNHYENQSIYLPALQFIVLYSGL